MSTVIPKFIVLINGVMLLTEMCYCFQLYSILCIVKSRKISSLSFHKHNQATMQYKLLHNIPTYSVSHFWPKNFFFPLLSVFQAAVTLLHTIVFKAEFAQVGIFFADRFPSLRNFWKSKKLRLPSIHLLKLIY